jgi:hypothetical protein
MRSRLLSCLRLALFAVGLGWVILGIWRGELAEIMRKAIIICLECIGIG